MKKQAISETRTSLEKEREERNFFNLKIFGALANKTPEALFKIMGNKSSDIHSKFTAYTAFFQMEVNRSREFEEFREFKFNFFASSILDLIEDFLNIQVTDPEVNSYTIASVDSKLSREQVLEKVITNILTDIFNETDNPNRHSTEKITRLFTLFDTVLKTMVGGCFINSEEYLKDFTLKTIDDWYRVNFSPSIGKIFSSGKAHLYTVIFRLFVFNYLLPKSIRDLSEKRFQAWFLLEQECMLGRKVKKEHIKNEMLMKFNELNKKTN